jgi:hypothetical protein
MLKQTLNAIRSEFRVPKIAGTVVSLLIAGWVIAWLTRQFPIFNRFNRIAVK